MMMLAKDRAASCQTLTGERQAEEAQSAEDGEHEPVRCAPIAGTSTQELPGGKTDGGLRKQDRRGGVAREVRGVAAHGCRG